MMLRSIRLSLAVLAAVGMSIVSVDSAQAWFRHGGGSCGSSGGYGSHGSFGSSGSFGGLFSRRGNDCGDGCGDYGSDEGGYGSCGSHGGAYYEDHGDNGDHENGHEHHAGYGSRSRENDHGQDYEPGEAPPAPPVMSRDEDGQNRDRAEHSNKSEKSKTRDKNQSSDQDKDDI